jgi:hypothetical protein
MVKPCKSNEKRIRSYSRSSGIKVKSHCRVSRKCSRGKKYRKSYTRKSGTRVKGHCVSSRRSSRRRVSRKKSRTRTSSRSSTSSSRQSYSRQEQPYSKTFESSYNTPPMSGITLSKQKKQERPDYEKKYDEEAEPSYFSEMQKEACVKLFQKYGLWSNKLDQFKKNFRQWSLRNHPDKNPEMADIYGQVSSCYKDTLKHVWNVSF